MRLWTVQPEELYEKLKTKKVLHCNPAQSELVTECGFGPAYDWISEQIKVRVGPPPKGIICPFWAWHTIDRQHKRPDLRRTEFRAYKGNQVCLEMEIPDSMVLLSNEDAWHIVLNDTYYGDCIDERKMEKEDAWFNNLGTGSCNTSL